MIVKDVLAYINSKTTSYSTIFVDVLEEGESLAIRQLGSDNNVNRYMDGTRVGNFDFAMFAKSADQEKAIEQLEAYEPILDLPENFQLTDQCSVKIEPNSDIRFVGENENGTTMYSNTFQVEYTIEK